MEKFSATFFQSVVQGAILSEADFLFHYKLELLQDSLMPSIIDLYTIIFLAKIKLLFQIVESKISVSRSWNNNLNINALGVFWNILIKLFKMRK